MANFEIYYPKLKKYEGGYASAKFAASIGDSGGETYKGIARNYNPNWPGWAIVDAWKAKNGEPKWNTFISDPKLDELAKSHSKKAYWDKLRLDEVKNQSVAEAIGDFGFNSGLGTAAKAVQRILKLPVDGSIGPKTLEAINGANQKKLFNDIQEYRKSFIGRITSLSEKVKASLLNRVQSIQYDESVEIIKNNPGKTIIGIMLFAGLIALLFKYTD